MRFSRFQIALLCVALTLASLALSRVMTASSVNRGTWD